VRGVLTAATTDAISIDGDEGHVELRLPDVERATVVFEWGPAPKPGGGKHGPKEQSRHTDVKAGAKGQGA
jgi:hypothetical protein